MIGDQERTEATLDGGRRERLAKKATICQELKDNKRKLSEDLRSKNSRPISDLGSEIEEQRSAKVAGAWLPRREW